MQKNVPDNIIYGVQPVREALGSGRRIKKIFMSREKITGGIQSILEKAAVRHIPVETCSKEEIERLSRTSFHQGVIALTDPYRYSTLDDTLCLIDCDGAPVAVAGVVTHGHHLNMRYGDFSKALSSVPDSVFSILLLHDPGGWDNCLAAGFAPDLTLSGHTHGMQIGLPVPGGYISPASLIHRYWSGLYTVGDASLLVSTGLGTMGMAARIFMPPEINVITVRKKPVPEN